jgi:hypothetical protein
VLVTTSHMKTNAQIILNSRYINSGRIKFQFQLLENELPVDCRPILIFSRLVPTCKNPRLFFVLLLLVFLQEYCRPLTERSWKSLWQNCGLHIHDRGHLSQSIILLRKIYELSNVGFSSDQEKNEKCYSL